MHWAEPSKVKQTRNSLGIQPIRLDGHRLQRAFHLTRLHKDRIKTSFDQSLIQPLRQRPGLQANRRDAAVQIIQPARQNLRCAFYLCLFEDLAILADHAD